MVQPPSSRPIPPQEEFPKTGKPSALQKDAEKKLQAPVRLHPLRTGPKNEECQDSGERNNQHFFPIVGRIGISK